jgi:hypothetical protein
MPHCNGGGAIAITDTSDPALPCCVSGNGSSVLVIANAVGLKIRGVSGVPEHRTEGVRDANGPASKKPRPVYTAITRYVTGENACYDPEDIQYSIFEHAHKCIYKSLQHYIPGNVKDPTDMET